MPAELTSALLNPLLFLVAFGFAMLCGSPYITFLKKRYMGQYIREDGPQSHHAKAGTPTAGGVLILSAMAFAALIGFVIQPKLVSAPEIWVFLMSTLALGALGFWDDYLKITKKHNKGLSGYAKLLVQGAIGLGVGWYSAYSSNISDVSFFHLFAIPLGGLYPLFSALVMVAASNAVNLTDGLDGLASGTSICSLMAFSVIFAGIGGHMINATELHMGLMTWILVGATMGFFFFNRHPARIFMGDCGSLALGGAIATLAVLGHLEFWLVLIGGVFVLETLSVILQVISFKTTGKRIFKMSPLHHHFELCGWHETKVVKTFIIFQFLLCVLAIFLYNI